MIMTFEPNESWDLVHLPIGCCCVYMVKLNPNGSLAHLKARLVVKSYSQKYGVDYHDTFSLVIRMTNVLILISLNNTYTLHHLDIKNASIVSLIRCMEELSGFVARV